MNIEMRSGELRNGELSCGKLRSIEIMSNVSEGRRIEEG
jgi:hypothetical protein